MDPVYDRNIVNISVLGNADSWYVAQLKTAAIERGHVCERTDFRRLSSKVAGLSLTVQSDEQALADADAIIVRTMPPGSLEQVVYRMDALLQLQRAGKVILNHPRAIECAVDKFLTTARLAEAQLPVPQSVVCESTDQAMIAFAELGGDVVVKPIFGAEGRGIIRLSDSDLAYRSFRTLERLNCVLYIQKFIQHDGFDVRVLLLDGQIIGAMKRRNVHDFRTNISRQGTAERHHLTDAEANLAISAAQAVQACFAGVDLLYDQSGKCHIIEVNAVPGWMAFQKITKIHVAERVIEYLEKH